VFHYIKKPQLQKACHSQDIIMTNIRQRCIKSEKCS